MHHRAGDRGAADSKRARAVSWQAALARQLQEEERGRLGSGDAHATAGEQQRRVWVRASGRARLCLLFRTGGGRAAVAEPTASLAAAVIAEEPARPPSRPIAREDKTPITIQAQQQTGYLAPSSAPSDANSMEVTSSFSYEVAPSASRPTTGLKSREKGSRGGSRQGIGALSRQSSRGAAAAAAASSGAAEPGTPS